MATSQNGWPAFTTSTALVNFPWVTGRVRPGDVYTVLDYLARRFNAEVEGIEAWQSWGWNYRAVRGSGSLSNHASGTAVDFNATRHVLGARNTFTGAQVAAIRRILASLGGVIRWGGDYTGRADEMHFEINANTARVAAVARAIGSGTVSHPIGGGGTITTPTFPGAPAPLNPGDDMPTMNEFLNTPAYDGGGTISQVLMALDRARADITAAKTSAATAVAQTGPIQRDRPYSLRQEVADAKTNTIALLARDAAQTELIRQLSAGGPGGAPVQVDYDRIDQATRAAISDLTPDIVADALADGVDVNLTISTTPTKEG